MEGDIIDVHLGGAPDASIESLEFPACFTLRDSQTQRLLLPNCGGLSIPFSMKDAPFLARARGYYEACIEQRGLMMPWIGVTDGDAGSMMLLTTPLDAQVKIDTDEHGYQACVSWRDSKGRMAYDRGVRYYFSPQGGHVRLCKLYRQYAMDAGQFVSLKQKREKTPTLDRFIGAMSLWVVDWPDIELFEKMKMSGLERLLVSFHASEGVPAEAREWIGRNTTYEPMDRSFVQQLEHLGYLAGRYDYYRTIFPPSPRMRSSNMWIMRTVGYPEQVAVDAEGRLRPGFGGGFGRGRGPTNGHRCSKCQFEMAKVYIPVDVERSRYHARLLDAVCAVSWQECYSESHPVTRTEDMRYRIKQLQVATDCGQITGTEHMAAWAVPVAHYGEGPGSFVRFHRMSTSARLKPHPIDVTDSYRQIVLNEQLRVPLWQLVFHDAVVITNRWNISPNRYTSREDWDREDLINLLHGQMPTMLLNRANYEANADRIAQTYDTVCRWNGIIGYEEMTDHCWLTDDRKVQQVTYASGAKLLVNFGEDDYTMPGGQLVPRRGFVTFP